MNKDIARWIKDGRKKGYNDEQLKSLLIKNKFSIKDIDDAFKETERASKNERVTESGKKDFDFWDNLKYIFSDPKKFFDMIKDEPAKYSFMIFIGTAIASTALSYFASSFMGGFAGLGVFSSYISLFLPVLIVIITLVHASLSHMMIRGMKGDGSGKDTMKVFCYSLVPYYIFTLIPIIGLFSIIYSYVLMVIGISKMHNLSTGKASAAVLFPPVFIIGSLILIVFFIIFRYFRHW